MYIQALQLADQGDLRKLEFLMKRAIEEAITELKDI
jgi:hypothetical protein